MITKNSEVISNYEDILEPILFEYIFAEDIQDILYRARRKYEELEKLKQDKNKKESSKDDTKTIKTSKKSKSNSDDVNFENEICAYTQNEKVREALREYAKMRKKKKKEICTFGTVTRVFNDLDKYGKTDEEKIEVLNYSIDNMYQGLFPLKSSILYWNNYNQNTKVKSGIIKSECNMDSEQLEQFILDKNDLDEF